jgi:hypothetical protein
VDQEETMAGSPRSDRWKQRPENSTWGDYGPNDQLGRMNELNAERTRQAVAEVKEGRTFCLSMPLDTPGGAVLNPRRHPPVLRPTLRGERPVWMYRTENDHPGLVDVINDDMVLLHLQYSSQWDTLAHVGALFDADGDGKADLTGCNPGWGCELAIENHLTAYQLRDTVTHKQGSYAALMADTIARFKQDKPVLYYTWTPYWVSAVLRPGADVVWLQVPFSSSQGGNADTQLPNGKNYGFQANQEQIVANRAFVEKNPAAGRLFEVMKLPIGDINAQNLRMSQGANTQQDLERHTDGWIRVHRPLFDGWIEQARAAAR